MCSAWLCKRVLRAGLSCGLVESFKNRAADSVCKLFSRSMTLVCLDVCVWEQSLSYRSFFEYIYQYYSGEKNTQGTSSNPGVTVCESICLWYSENPHRELPGRLHQLENKPLPKGVSIQTAVVISFWQ